MVTSPIFQLSIDATKPPRYHYELAKELAESSESTTAPKDRFCVLMAVSYTSAAVGMVVLAEALVRRTKESSRIYALKLLRPTERTSNLVGDAQVAQTAEVAAATFGPLLGQAQQHELALRPISFVSSQPARDICNVAETKGADLVLLGWQRPLLNNAALGGTVNEKTMNRFKFKIVCGAANNQLANNAIGEEVQKRGIVYAPDYAVNAGGLMNVSIELDGYDRERAMRMLRSIYYNVGAIFKIAKRDGIATWKAADRMAEERINAIGKIKLPHMGNQQTRFLGRMRGQ